MFSYSTMVKESSCLVEINRSRVNQVVELSNFRLHGDREQEGSDVSGVHGDEDESEEQLEGNHESSSVGRGRLVPSPQEQSEGPDS